LYNVLIVDDEPVVLEAISKNIEWTKFGFNHPETCEDGQVAIDLLCKGFKPNLVITDICMPNKDGFELINKINELNLDCKIIILSGYDDFAYAQRAIKSSVFDYLVKPITPKQINSLLETVRIELDKPNLEEMSKYMQETVPFFLSKWLTRSMDNSIIDSNCKLHSLNFIGDCYNIILIDADCGRIMDIEQSNTQALYQFALQNIVSELISDYKNMYTFSISEGETAIIFYDQTKELISESINDISLKIIEIAENFLQTAIYVGVGKPVSDIYSFHQSYKFAKKALFYRFLYDKSTIIQPSLFNRTTDFEASRYHVFERDILEYICQFDKNMTLQCVDSFISELRENQVTLEKSILYSQNIIISIINKTLDLSGKKYVEEFSNDKSHLFNVTNLENLSNYIKKVCEYSFDLLLYREENSMNVQIAKAELYMKEHYSDSDLTLNTLTDYVCVSISHFSTIFKSKTGMTFVEYLTNIRINKAKQELLLSDKKAYLIADSVGFADSHYFSVVFKRIAGVTPKQYRENNKL